MQQMNEPATSKLYDLWAWFYDCSFGALVHRRQVRAVEQLRLRPGERVLDIGVGTGMTLKHYPADVRVVGMDLSGGMLAKAVKKIRDDGLDRCLLVQADAMLPPFADQSFDHVMITHTVSVVSDPSRLIAWARRLVKPGGRVVVLNHFLSGNPLIAWIEKVANPLCVRIGWRSNLSLEECLAGADLHVQYHFKMALLDLWQIVVLTSSDGPSPPRPAADRSPAAELARPPRAPLAFEGH